MPLAAKRVLSFISLSLLCLFFVPSAGATVFRDRVAFEADAQNLCTIDFDTGPRPNTVVFDVDGVRLRGLSTHDIFTATELGEQETVRGHRRRNHPTRNLPAAGDVAVSITVRGAESNRVTLRVN